MAVLINNFIANGYDYDEALLRRHILECQWEKKRGGSKNCNICNERFKCHTMTARRFDITNSSMCYTTYEVFAEDADEANDIWVMWYGEDKLITPIEEDYGDSDIEIDEVPLDL